MKRKLFLEAFLGALGAKEILWTDFKPDKVYGTVGGIAILTFIK